MSPTIDTAKTLEKIIVNRIENKVKNEFGEDQFGFRKNKGKSILNLRILIESQIKFNKDIFVVFVDLDKTFVTVEKAFSNCINE